MKQIKKKFSLLSTAFLILFVSAIAISCGETAEPAPEPPVEETTPPPPPAVDPVDTTKTDSSAEARPVPIKKG